MHSTDGTDRTDGADGTDGRNGLGLMADSAELGRDVRLAYWVDRKLASRAGTRGLASAVSARGRSLVRCRTLQNPAEPIACPTII